MQRNSKDKDSDAVCIGKFSEGRAVFSDGRRGKSGGGGGRFGFWRTVRHPDAPGSVGVGKLVSLYHGRCSAGKIASPDDSGTSSGPWKSWNDFSGRRGGRSDWNCDGFPNRGCV